MISDNLWPAVGAMLHARYVEQRAAWMARHSDIITPWPRRRTKRRPLPGVIDASEQEG